MRTKSEEPIPGKSEFLRRVGEYERSEDVFEAMYKVATFLVDHFWGEPAEMANGLGVLLLTWNQAFYRYGPLSLVRLEECIKRRLASLKDFRDRDILDFTSADEHDVRDVFIDFLQALQISEGKMKGRRSPVSVAKALHLLAPAFFPLWDDKIARAYGCYYNNDPQGRYVSFCHITKQIAGGVRGYAARTDKTLTKLIDQYNYVKYTLPVLKRRT